MEMTGDLIHDVKKKVSYEEFCTFVVDGNIWKKYVFF